MLACAGVDRQYEHQPSWAAGPIGHGGRCDRELHADADRRVYACQLSAATCNGWTARSGRLDIEIVADGFARRVSQVWMGGILFHQYGS